MMFDGLRLRHRRKALDGAAIGIDEKFGEIPFDAAAEKTTKGTLEQLKDWMGIGAVDIYLFE